MNKRWALAAGVAGIVTRRGGQRRRGGTEGQG